MPIYMKVDGITGSVKDGPHAGWIELESVQFGASRYQSGDNGEKRPGPQPASREIVISKRTDASSTSLFRMSLSGTGRKVQIDFVKTDGKTVYLSLTLTETLLASYQTSRAGAGNADKPLETLALSADKITSSPGPAAAGEP